MRYAGIVTGIVGVLLIWTGAGAGAIKGTVTAKKARDIQNAVVYIDVIPGKIFPAPTEHAKIDQKNMKFLPHVLPVLAGTTIDFFNNDQVLHNVFTPSETADRFNLGTWPKGEVRSYNFEKAGSAVLLCNVHPEMEGYIVVLPTPYFATTDKNGHFVIEGVPAGDYTVKVWNKNRKLETEPQHITVSGTGTTEIGFALESWERQ